MRVVGLWCGVAGLALVASPASAFVELRELDTSLPLCAQEADAAERNVSCFSPLFTTYPRGTMVYALREDAVDDLQCTGDYFLPVFAGEPLWSNATRTVFYMALMVWSFLGVAIISDHFMASIEVITSKERIIVVENENGDSEERKVLIWDETVANLSLMALGSSAPEILLSVVETLGTLDKEPEDGLGPSTIVGSAAFNLLCISAVCVAALKDGEKRVIEGYGVFIVTATFSVFAYVWMFLVLYDEIVTLVEATITFLLFPTLVAVSYAQNKGWWGLCGSQNERKVRPEGHVVAIDGENHKHMRRRSSDLGQGGSSSRIITVQEKEKEQLAHLIHKLPADLTDEEMAKLAAQGIMQSQHAHKSSALRYRIDARRKIAGGRGIIQRNLNVIKKHTIRRFSQIDSPAAAAAAAAAAANAASSKGAAPGAEGGSAAEIAAKTSTSAVSMPCVSFSSYAFSVNENAGRVVLPVLRTGTATELSRRSRVFYETRSGTARGSEDFVHVHGDLIFEPGEKRKEVVVEIIDDNVFEPDETFHVVLSAKGPEDNADLVRAEFTTAEVTIIDDDHPGTFSFPSGGLVVRESDGLAKCLIKRQGGVDGRVKLQYRTKDASAKKDSEYYEATGTVVFDHGVNETTIDIVLIDDKSYDKDLTFALEFEIVNWPDCGAEYGEHRVLSVTITSDERYKATVDRVADLMQVHLENAEVGSGSWGEQLREALTLEGEDGEDPTIVDAILHILSFAWKVLFTLVPPTSYCSGYLSFFVSLIFIGVLTAFVGDIARVFGCLVGAPNSLTAITFVALGTSLPDTFASKTAAENDSTADNSIGNVTGSNSVNVFLGLGLPWLIGSIYKASKGEPYIVKSQSLSFSVAVFCGVAFVYFVIMYSRRRLGYGELGGPARPKWVTVVVFVLLWCVYVGLSGANSLGLL